MGVGQLSESDAVDALRLPFYSSSHPTGSHGWRNQFDLGNPDSEELPAKVAGDRAYQNAMANSDQQNARIEHDKALERAMTEYVADPIELFKQFSDNDSFRRWLSEMVFAATYNETAATASASRSLDV